MTTKGSCACGQITYEFTDQFATALCYCVDCQKWTGSAYTTNVGVPLKSLNVTKGTPKKWVTTAASGKNNTRSFCGNCGSSLFSQVEMMPDNIFVKAGCLDEGKSDMGGKIETEFYTSHRPWFAKEVEGATQVVGFP